MSWGGTNDRGYGPQPKQRPKGFYPKGKGKLGTVAYLADDEPEQTSTGENKRKMGKMGKMGEMGENKMGNDDEPSSSTDEMGKMGKMGSSSSSDAWDRWRDGVIKGSVGKMTGKMGNDDEPNKCTSDGSKLA